MMYIKFLIWFLIFINVSFYNVFSLPISDQCTTKANGPGKCLRPGKCEALITNKIKIEMFNKCNTRGLICCPNLMNLDNNIESYKIIPAIVNGESINNIEKYPFMVGLGTKLEDSDTIDWKCGGSIIGNRLILTAAHCTDITHIVFGTNNLAEVKPNQIISKPNFEFIPHELYKKVPGNDGPYDIAIIKLKTGVEFNTNVNSITLASEVYIEASLLKVAQVIGFGSTESYGSTSSIILKEIKLHELECPEYFTITNQICYEDTENNPETKKSTCRGDSGGPLFVKNSNGQYVQIGIVSYSFASCGLAPTVFTSINVFGDWIKLQK